MAKLPPYNPRADIAFLYGEIEKLHKNYDKLMKAVENATIIDKGEGSDLQVVYDISNGNKESDKLQGRILAVFQMYETLFEALVKSAAIKISSAILEIVTECLHHSGKLFTGSKF